MGALTTAMLSVARTRKAMFGLTGAFLIQGALAVSWLPRIPEIIDHLNVQFATWGLIVGVAGLGSLVPLTFTNTLINRFGTRPLMQLSLLVSAACIGVLGFITNPWIFFAVVFTQNLGFGIYNLAINSHSVVFQNRIGRVVLGRFHAAWSLGAAGSSLLTGLFAAVVSLEHYLAVVAAIVVVLMFVSTSQMLGPSQDGHEQEKDRAEPIPLRKTPRKVVILAFGLFFAVMPEATMMDWGAVFGKRVMELPVALQGLPYTIFVVSMIVSRLSIGRLTKRHHLSRIAQVASVMGAIGVSLAAVLGTIFGGMNPVLALALTALFWAATGLGSGPQVPAIFSVAGSVPGMTTAQVMSRMSLANSTLILLIKIVMGAMAQGIGVPSVFVISVISFLGAGLVARYVLKLAKEEKPKPAATEDEQLADAFPVTSPLMVIPEQPQER